MSLFVDAPLERPEPSTEMSACGATIGIGIKVVEDHVLLTSLVLLLPGDAFGEFEKVLALPLPLTGENALDINVGKTKK